MGRTIDVHAHYLPRTVVETASTGGSWHGFTVARGEDGTPRHVTNGTIKVTASSDYLDEPAERIRKMTAVGVDMQVLSLCTALHYRYQDSGSTSVSAVREINDEIASVSAGWPEHFLGYATLPLQDTDAAVAELERAVRTLGLVGVSVGTHVNGENWDAPRLLPVLQAAEALGAVVFVHPVEPRVEGTVAGYHLHNLIGNPYETTVAIGSLIFGGVLDQVPDVKMIFCHAGGFSYANAGRFDHGYRMRQDTSERAQRLPSDYLRRLYFDCISHDGTSLRHLLDVVGSTQVLLGTDYPADMGLAEPVAWLGSCRQVTADEQRMILSDNAHGLLGERAAVTT